MKNCTASLDLSFQVTAIAPQFANRIRSGLPDDFGRAALRVVAAGGEPIRDQLRRAAPGEQLFLCSYQAVALPALFAEIGPVFISVESARPAPVWRDELPPGYFPRTFAVRAYDRTDSIIDSTLVEPHLAPASIRLLLARPAVSYLHARFAGNGCYACRFDRIT